MTQLGIRNKLFFHPARLNNIIDINLDKISVGDILSSNDLGIYYVKYDGNEFYLVIDDIKGYFETKDDNINYLTIIFDNEKYEKIFKDIWDKIKENKFDECAKNYNVISFKSDDILKYRCAISINTITIIIRSVFKNDCYYYPQIYLDNCSYNYKNE